MYAYTCTYACTHIYNTWAPIQACINTYIHTYIHMLCSCSVLKAWWPTTCRTLHARIRACINTCIHTYIHTYNTYMHTYIHYMCFVAAQPWRHDDQPRGDTLHARNFTSTCNLRRHFQTIVPIPRYYPQDTHRPRDTFRMLQCAACPHTA